MKSLEAMRLRLLGAAPKPQETYATLDAAARDKAAGRNKQLNMRVAQWAKDRVKAHKKAERATYGEVLESMLAAYEAAGAGLKAGRAPVDEAHEGRLRPVQFWASEGVYQTIGKVAAARDLSISALMEDWLAREVNELDPQRSGKFGVWVKSD